jgi:type IV fimbrial biogenesis protein FimT
MNMKNNRGFTLIELLVTVAVLIVLLVVGVPEYRRLTENNRQVTALNTMVGDLNLARTEAVKQGRTVTLCGSTDGATCNTANWESGWIVFTDWDGERDIDAGDGDILISRNTSLPVGLTLRGIKFANANYVQYQPSGTMVDDDDGTFVVCDEQTANETSNVPRARAVNVNGLGRISVAKDPDGNGIRNDIENANVTCP